MLFVISLYMADHQTECNEINVRNKLDTNRIFKNLIRFYSIDYNERNFSLNIIEKIF